MIAEAEELITVGYKLGIEIEALPGEQAEAYIHRTLNLHTPFKITGHLGIGYDSIELSIEK